MKILAISNSFGDDAARNLHFMAEGVGENIEITNLYIGGCTQKRHWENIQSGEKVYEHKVNGNEPDKMCSILDGLTEQKWDIIVTQQGSGYSGIWGSYTPYLEKVIAYVRRFQPTAKLYLQQTWSYEYDSTHEHFVWYKNQKDMYDRLTECYYKGAKLINAEIIPVGEVIQELRATKAFDCANGGIRITRDGFHLSYSYGRYAASATWLYKLTGKLPSEDYLPIDDLNVDKNTLKDILEIVEKVVNKNS